MSEASRLGTDDREEETSHPERDAGDGDQGVGQGHVRPQHDLHELPLPPASVPRL